MTTIVKLGCCPDIISLHAELIHHQSEIQYSQIPFTAQDWRGLDYLKIIQNGTPGLNEIGPHAMPFGMTYSVTVQKLLAPNSYRTVDVSIFIDSATGLITFWKSSKVPAFSGRVEVR